MSKASREHFEREYRRLWEKATPEDRVFMEESGARANERVTRRVQWVKQLAEVTNAIANGSGAWQDIALFWLRLLDVAEVFGYVEAHAQLRDDLDRIGATLYRLIE